MEEKEEGKEGNMLEGGDGDDELFDTDGTFPFPGMGLVRFAFLGILQYDHVNLHVARHSYRNCCAMHVMQFTVCVRRSSSR